VLDDLPAGLVRWGAPPTIDLHRHPTGLDALDRVLGGGWPTGRLCTLRAGSPGLSGRTAVALASVADLTARGGVAAWIDGDGSLDPASLQEAGADLARVLWVRGPLTVSGLLAATDAVVRAGGFGMAVVRPSEAPGWAAHASSWLRVARVVERSRTTVLVLDRGDVASAHAAVRVGVSLDGASWWGTRGPGHVLAGAQIRLAGPEGMADLELWTPAARVFPVATGGQRRQSMLERDREPDRSVVSLR
jgi:hypothetical protein